MQEAIADVTEDAEHDHQKRQFKKKKAVKSMKVKRCPAFVLTSLRTWLLLKMTLTNHSTHRMAVILKCCNEKNSL